MKNTAVETKFKATFCVNSGVSVSVLNANKVRRMTGIYMVNGLNCVCVCNAQVHCTRDFGYGCGYSQAPTIYLEPFYCKYVCMCVCALWFI